MDDWGWQELQRWLPARVGLPIGPLFCIIDGRTRGRPWTSAGARAELRRTAEIIETFHARRAPMIPVTASSRS